MFSIFLIIQFMQAFLTISSRKRSLEMDTPGSSNGSKRRRNSGNLSNDSENARNESPQIEINALEYIQKDLHHEHEENSNTALASVCLMQY